MATVHVLSATRSQGAHGNHSWVEHGPFAPSLAVLSNITGLVSPKHKRILESSFRDVQNVRRLAQACTPACSWTMRHSQGGLKGDQAACICKGR